MKKKTHFVCQYLENISLKALEKYKDIIKKAVTKREMNGWQTWTYERAPGDWVLLKELRK